MCLDIACQWPRSLLIDLDSEFETYGIAYGKLIYLDQYCFHHLLPIMSPTEIKDPGGPQLVRLC